MGPLSYCFETAITIFCNVYEYTFQMIPHTFGHLDWYRPTPVADGLDLHHMNGIMHKWANPHFDDLEKKSRSNMKYRIKRINTN